MKPLLVGEAPGRGASSQKPLAHSRRLYQLLGRGWWRLFATANLLHRWPGRAGKGSRFTAGRVARLRARQMLHQRDVVIVCGRRAARAFGLTGREPYLQWMEVSGTHVAILPHPSGINRWWNDPDNRHRAEQFLRNAANREV